LTLYKKNNRAVAVETVVVVAVVVVVADDAVVVADVVVVDVDLASSFADDHYTNRCRRLRRPFDKTMDYLVRNLAV